VRLSSHSNQQLDFAVHCWVGKFPAVHLGLRLLGELPKVEGACWVCSCSGEPSVHSFCRNGGRTCYIGMAYNYNYGKISKLSSIIPLKVHEKGHHNDVKLMRRIAASNLLFA